MPMPAVPARTWDLKMGRVGLRHDACGSRARGAFLNFQLKWDDLVLASPAAAAAAAEAAALHGFTVGVPNGWLRGVEEELQGLQRDMVSHHPRPAQVEDHLSRWAVQSRSTPVSDRFKVSRI